MQLSLLSNRLYLVLKKKPLLLVHLPLALYWAAIFIATSLPIEKLPRVFNMDDKLEHFAAYFILALVTNLSFHFQNYFRPLSEKRFFYSILILLFYAAFDEIHQLLIPGRYCDVFDWVFDALGITAGTAVAGFFIAAQIKNVNKNRLKNGEQP